MLTKQITPDTIRTEREDRLIISVGLRDHLTFTRAAADVECILGREPFLAALEVSDCFLTILILYYFLLFSLDVTNWSGAENGNSGNRHLIVSSNESRFSLRMHDGGT